MYVAAGEMPPVLPPLPHPPPSFLCVCICPIPVFSSAGRDLLGTMSLLSLHGSSPYTLLTFGLPKSRCRGVVWDSVVRNPGGVTLVPSSDFCVFCVRMFHELLEAGKMEKPSDPSLSKQI